MEKCGFGNWKNIADYISTKTMKQVEDHVYDVYFKLCGYCLPQTFLHNGQVASTSEYLQKQDNLQVPTTPMDGADVPQPFTTNLEDTASTASGYSDSLQGLRVFSSSAPSPFSAASGSSPQLPDLMLMNLREGLVRGAEVTRDKVVPHHGPTGKAATLSKQQSHSQSTASLSSLQGGASTTAVASSSIPGAAYSTGAVGATTSSSSSSAAVVPAPVTYDLPGFMPLREDFDVEHENDAEMLLADMEFSPDDHVSERELKLQVIRIYYQKLDERNRRKRFVIDRGLVDIKKQQAVSSPAAVGHRYYLYFT
jgi:hypothetical protein